MNWRLLLAPLSPIYWCVTALRNLAFSCGLFSSAKFSRPVICIGNITVGGTGKTPLTEHVLRSLAHRHVAVVSRGYGRKTSGLLVASPLSTADQIGDEPCQMKHKFPAADVVVCANRAEAISLAFDSLSADVVVMDDGMQHRSVSPSFVVMVCDFARPIWSDITLPAGDLREPWSARLRADVVVVNKCPVDLSVAQADAVRRNLKLRPSQKLFFCSIGYAHNYSALYNCDAVSDFVSRPALALAGVGRPQPFFDEVASRHAVVRSLAFPDHHVFAPDDVSRIQAALDALGPDALLVTTEKDAMRLPPISGHPVVCLPITIHFLFDGQSLFDSLIAEAASH